LSHHESWNPLLPRTPTTACADDSDPDSNASVQHRNGAATSFSDWIVLWWMLFSMQIIFLD
jgi:hypothetical protein